MLKVGKEKVVLAHATWKLLSPVYHSHNIDFSIHLPCKLSKHLPMNYMPCYVSALPSHQKEENVTALLISPSHNLNRNRVSPSDSRSIAVRGAGVDHTARVHTGLPGCPTYSLYGKKGTLPADMEPILGLTAVSQGQSGHVFSTVKADPFRGVF